MGINKQDYQSIIFDLDGTLLDTSEGILNSIDYAVNILKLPIPTLEEKYKFIGPPVCDSFINILQLNEELAKEATILYRQRYAEKGKYESKTYDGILDLLKQLNAKGFKLGIATLKGEVIANEILKYFNLKKYFGAIYGQNSNDTRNKADTIQLSLDKLDISANNALMVGDSMHDYNGSNIVGIDFCAVTYGFGFNLETAKGKYVIKKPLDLLSIIKI